MFMFNYKLDDIFYHMLPLSLIQKVHENDFINFPKYLIQTVP